MNKFSVRVVNNGFILYDAVFKKDIATTGCEYVFETFDSLVKFLDSKLKEPNRNER